MATSAAELQVESGRPWVSTTRHSTGVRSEALRVDEPWLLGVGVLRAGASPLRIKHDHLSDMTGR